MWNLTGEFPTVRAKAIIYNLNQKLLKTNNTLIFISSINNMLSGYNWVGKDNAGCNIIKF